MRVRELREILEELPDEARVMVASARDLTILKIGECGFFPEANVLLLMEEARKVR